MTLGAIECPRAESLLGKRQILDVARKLFVRGASLLRFHVRHEHPESHVRNTIARVAMSLITHQVRCWIDLEARVCHDIVGVPGNPQGSLSESELFGCHLQLVLLNLLRCLP